MAENVLAGYTRAGLIYVARLEFTFSKRQLLANILLKPHETRRRPFRLSRSRSRPAANGVVLLGTFVEPPPSDGEQSWEKGTDNSWDDSTSQDRCEKYLGVLRRGANGRYLRTTIPGTMYTCAFMCVFFQSVWRGVRDVWHRPWLSDRLILVAKMDGLGGCPFFLWHLMVWWHRRGTDRACAEHEIAHGWVKKTAVTLFGDRRQDEY